MKPLRIAACILSIALSACVENEEEITIRPDGSSSVRLSAKGKVEDLADGYGLPLTAPWTATTPDTLEWLRRLGPDTGSPAVRENARHWDTGRNPMGSEQDLELEVRADFASVKDWPRWYAPESEVYRSAYLERSASLKIESKSGRKLYTFERDFHAREWERIDLMSQIKRAKGLPDGLLKRLEDKDPELTEPERIKLAHLASDAMRRTSMSFVVDAVGSVYTQGNASLSPSSSTRIRTAVAAEIDGLVNEKRLQEVLDFEIPRESGAEKSEEDKRSFKSLEKDLRSTLRTALGSALAAQSVPSSMQNAIRGQLEWQLTAYDATVDLADEDFKVTVHMPGTIVGGNFDEIEGDAAHWRFSGTDLQDKERVLRVVSVVE